MHIYIASVSTEIGQGPVFYAAYADFEKAQKTLDAEMLSRTTSEKKLEGEEWKYLPRNIWQRRYAENAYFIIELAEVIE